MLLEGMILVLEFSSESPATVAQEHEDTRKAPEGDVLFYRNAFLYTSESGLSDLACDNATPSRLWP